MPSNCLNTDRTGRPSQTRLRKWGCGANQDVGVKPSPVRYSSHHNGYIYPKQYTQIPIESRHVMPRIHILFLHDNVMIVHVVPVHPRLANPTLTTYSLLTL